MLIDELKIHAKAGDGGNGVVRWRHEPGKEYAGPSGGDGGRGGSVYAEAARDIFALADYRNKKEFNAGRGQDGMKESMHGANGADLILKLPVGSIIKNSETGEEIELIKEGEKTLLLAGGNGGLGNERFKSSVNRSPEEWTPGKPGQEADFFIELRLVADIGLIGLPNAGKSSLLNALTRARAKVGAYPFTTLDPNLGELYGFVLADMPGLIESASEGKGLGFKFLRHISRTRLLAHLISLENEDPMKVYKSIRGELEKYDPELAKKEEIIVLSKSDLVDVKTAKKRAQIFRKLGKKVFIISVLDDALLKSFRDELIKILKVV